MTRENRLVLVGCSSGKRKGKHYPWKLYESDYFDKRMTLAMMLGTPAILSAEHGYLPCHERIERYDTDLREKEDHEIESWSLSVANHIPEHYDSIVILAGKKYRTTLEPILMEDGYEVYSPFDSENIGGIGEQIGWCKQTVEEIENGKNVESVLSKHEQKGV